MRLWHFPGAVVAFLRLWRCLQCRDLLTYLLATDSVYSARTKLME